jgi:hypothetical protein
MNRILVWLVMPQALTPRRKLALWSLAIFLIAAVAYAAEAIGMSHPAAVLAMAILTVPLCAFLASALGKSPACRVQEEESKQVRVARV